MDRVIVTGDGTIILGEAVTCDGFHYDIPIRIQSHCHKDHMDEFSRSKGLQTILMTEPTRDLLIAEYDADIPYRENIIAVPMNNQIDLMDLEIKLLDNGHMLGSSQIEVKLSDGYRCGYSGDFDWPLQEVIQVDSLVVDSTYGSPDSIRRFSQDEANEKLLDLVIRKAKSGPVYIKAHRGTLQRAITILNGEIKHPITSSQSLYNEMEVYLRYGYNLSEVISVNTEDGKKAHIDGNYIHLCRAHEKNPSDSTSIILSAYMSRMEEALVQYSDNAFAVALSNHADFTGTLEYISATGAEFVITDNTRGGKAIELAQAIKRELGIKAEPSIVTHKNEWGQ